MYVNEIDIEVMIVEKMIELVFTEMVYRKIEQLEGATLCKYDETDGNQWTRFRNCIEVLDDEERCIRYAGRSLELLNYDIMWQGIVEDCKILKYPELSEIHIDCFESLFDMLCFVWLRMYSETEKTSSINNLIDCVICVCKLKYNSTVESAK